VLKTQSTVPTPLTVLPLLKLHLHKALLLLVLLLLMPPLLLLQLQLLW
jgi:hypothetical protein